MRSIPFQHLLPSGSADTFAEDSSGELPGNLTAGRRPSMAVNSTISPVVHGRTLADWCAGVAERINGGGYASIDQRTLERTTVLVTLLAQGTPMLSSADIASEEGLREVRHAWFVRQRLRGAMQPPTFDFPRDMAWCSANGTCPAWDAPRDDTDSYLAVSIAAEGVPGVYFGVNPTVRTLSVTLPPPPSRCSWRVVADTSVPCTDVEAAVLTSSVFELSAKACFVLEAVTGPGYDGAAPASPSW